MRLMLIACAAAVLGAAGALSAQKGGDAAKGKATFDQQCLMCHNANSAEKKVGPGLKGLFHRDKLSNGKKATEQNIRLQVDDGGNGMPAYKDMLSPQERADVMAYLKTL